MKKLSSVLLILLSVCSINPPSFSQNCTYSWSQQNSGTTRILYTCKAVNELVCWTAGANATVLRTTDGGNTWLNVSPTAGLVTGDFRNMEAVDETTALVTTETQTTTAVYKTTDGGESWFVVYSNTEGFIKGIRMIDSLNGIAVGNPIIEQPNVLRWNVLLTTDGGNTWQPSPNRPPAEFIHQAVHNSFQVSMPNIYWGTSFTSIFRSTDGGLTYTENETPGAGIYIFALFINPSGIGMAAATEMSRSTDGGITFLPHSVPGGGNINGIESSGNNFWYIRGEKIFHSTDDGISWTDEYTAPLTLTHMDFPDNLNGCRMGWAVGYGGTILKMTGDGVTSMNNQRELPAVYELMQNYPNPFNPTTKIKFTIPTPPISSPLVKGRTKEGFVSLKVYDVLGNEISILVNEEKQPGAYEVEFNTSSHSGKVRNLSSGIYFYKLSSGAFTEIKKMILTK